MNIKINYPEGNEHIKNLAFIKALLIKCSIENLDINTKEKEKLKDKILDYLKNN